VNTLTQAKPNWFWLKKIIHRNDTIRDEEGGGRRERRESDVMARVWS